tara:strand:+ start:36930 stop:38813 length:1884 start_codon:yes stop_codon:yes gene_type:complete
LRSLIVTILLLVTAALLGCLAVWQLREGSLDRLLGPPPTAVGEKIYPDFEPEAVTSITLNSGDIRAHFIKTETGWEATSPWRDRMDPRAAIAILTFTNTATVRDFVPRDSLDPSLAGLATGNTEILLKNDSGERVAFFRLGRRTPLLDLTEEDNPQPIPTTYLLPLESGRKSHVYAATGYILPLFKDGFKYLRDHRPLHFNPLALEKIRLRTDQGDLTLGRVAPNTPWRIVKPLDLSTNPTAVKKLLEGLVTLQAITLSNRSEATLPSNGTTQQNGQIAITPFGSTTETVLDILPSESPEARETQATISNRPDTLFTIPLKTDLDLTSLSDLPRTVNDLRDPTLTNLNIASVRGIAIKTATTPTILISRQPPAPWTATINGISQPANEQRLFNLLKAATETRAVAFETDAAPEDLSPWGLHRPILTLSFIASNNQALAISFGLNKRGNLFAKRNGSPSIMRLENSFLDSIAVRPNDWRHARLWSLSKVDLTDLTRTETGSSPLELTYNDLTETWKATQSEKEVTANLDPARAKFILGILENLQVSRWLSPNDKAATAALATPTLTFDIKENTVDDFGDKNGTKSQTLTLAPDPTTDTVFGKISTDSSPFTITPESYVKLSILLLDQQ